MIKSVYLINFIRSGGVGLFTGEPLGIFTKEDMKSAKPGNVSVC